jgi:uncharacterized protein (DUF2147 family)
MKNLLIIVSVVMCTAFVQDGKKAAVAKDDIMTTWWNQEKDAKVKIFLAANGKYSGKIEWMKEPNDASGKPKVDDKNPDAKKRTNPKLGLTILWNFTFNESNKRWEGGTIYDPKNGKKYDSYMYFDGDKTDKLNLRGYVMGMSMLGRTSVWEKVK